VCSSIRDMLSPVCGHALMQALLTTSEQCVAETRAAGTEGGGVRTYARSASTGTQKCQSSPRTRSSPSCHSCRWPACHPRSMPPTSPCNCEKSAHESIKVEKGETNIPVRVPGQGRLAISRLRVPNLDGAVATAAGNLLSIRAPRHRKDPEIK
jgi:hypothetical protein